MFTEKADAPEWVWALRKQKAQVMLWRRLRPERRTYDPFTLRYLCRLSESIRSVIRRDTLQLLEGKLSNLIMLNSASQQAVPIFADEDFTIRVPLDALYWWIAVYRWWRNTDLMLWVHEREKGSFTGVPVNRNGELIRNKGMMYCFFPNRALIHFSFDTPQAFVEDGHGFTDGIDKCKWGFCLLDWAGLG